MIRSKSDKNIGTERKIKILVGEFDPFLRGLLVECLEDEYEVKAVDNGDDLERELLNQPYDLVISEVRMPGKSLREIDRALPQSRKDIPRILLGSNGIDFILPACDDSPALLAAHILPKPFGLGDLFGEIRRALGEASAIGA